MAVALLVAALPRCDINLPAQKSLFFHSARNKIRRILFGFMSTTTWTALDVC